MIGLTLCPVFGHMPIQKTAGLPHPVPVLCFIRQADPVGRRMVKPAIQLQNKKDKC